MKKVFKFSPPYFTLAIILFLVEVFIALYVHDNIIRPYIGDVLVVILLYCSIKAVLDYPVIKTAFGVLLFAFAIEIFQYIHIVNILGLENNAFARTVIGTSFEWIDILAYCVGTALTITVEKLRK